MAKVIIFGLRDFASLAHFYLKHDSAHEVVAFTVDREYLPDERTFEGLPVVPFEEVAQHYPPGEFAAFAPMSHRRMNQQRRDVYERFRSLGYTLISYVSSRAFRHDRRELFHSGDNTSSLCDRQQVVLWSGNHIGHHSSIGDHVFFTSHVVLSGHCTVEPHCFFGVNATIRDGLRIGEGTLVGMGAVVTRETQAWSVYKGTPAIAADVSSRDLDF
jgi:serine acetyltransferase